MKPSGESLLQSVLFVAIGGKIAMRIAKIDHLVLTVRDIAVTGEFYSRVLGMDVVTFGSGRKALEFGTQKINLHEVGKEFEPKAARPTPGSADICFISAGPIADVLDHLRSVGVPVLEGPVQRTGASGSMLSVYFRDPDDNLIEIGVYSGTGPSV
jgi:catechol 2,3-dioxygenase-like lactoylglutathione lyase family enzyme